MTNLTRKYASESDFHWFFGNPPSTDFRIGRVGIITKGRIRKLMKVLNKEPAKPRALCNLARQTDLLAEPLSLLLNVKTSHANARAARRVRMPIRQSLASSRPCVRGPMTNFSKGSGACTSFVEKLTSISRKRSFARKIKIFRSRTSRHSRSFRGNTLSIRYSRFGSRLRLQSVAHFEPGLYLTTLSIADRSDMNLELFSK